MLLNLSIISICNISPLVQNACGNKVIYVFLITFKICNLITVPTEPLKLNCMFQELNGTVGESESECMEFPLLTFRSLSSITQLVPFFQTLCCSFCSSTPSPHPPADYPPSSADRVLQSLELITEEEFLDGMDS